MALGAVAVASAQEPPAAAPGSGPSGAIAISASAGEARLTVTPRTVGPRTLLDALSSEAGFEVRNLAQVPDDPVLVQFADVPVDEAVAALLRDARVDFIVRAEPGARVPSLVIVSDRPPAEMVAARAPGRPGAMPASGPAPALATPAAAFEPPVAGEEVPWDVDQGAQPDEPPPPRDPAAGPLRPEDLPTPAAVDLPSLGPAGAMPGTSTPGMTTQTAAPAAIPLDVSPSRVEVEGGPTWQPLDFGPQAAPLPPGMTAPKLFPVVAPPPAGTAATPKPPGSPD